jgi:hypothetical protein
MKYLRFAGALLLMLWAGEADACKCRAMPDNISNIQELKDYAFIGLARVERFDSVVARQDSGNDFKAAAWRIRVIEVFKGDTVELVYEPYKFTSCGLKLEEGDEWVFFAKRINGRLSILPCEWNAPYKLAKGDDTNHWKPTGALLLKRLRELYGNKQAGMMAVPGWMAVMLTGARWVPKRS